MIRQRGSHRFYRATVDGVTAQTTVPQHVGDLETGTLAAIEHSMEPAFGRGGCVAEVIYGVVVTRQDDWWLARVPSLAGAHTESRTLATLDRDVREVIALVEDLPAGAEAALRLSWEFRTGDAIIDELTAALRNRRIELVQAESDLAARTAALARRLRSQWSVRDVATLLGISPQRVSQIAPDERPMRRGRRRSAA